MNEINISRGEISKIVKAIDEIAFQTNILALNVSVDATQAGTDPDFAMVAAEIRSLKQYFTEAIKETE